MNTPARLLIASTALAAMAATSSIASAQPLLKIDFGRGAAVSLQPGFTAVNGAVTENEHSDAIGPYSVFLSGDGFFSAGNAGNIGAAVRPLFRDYYYNNSPAQGDGVVLSLGGFEAGASYDLTLWSYDADNVFSSTPTTWTPFNGTEGPTGNITNFAQPPYPSPTTLNEFSATIPVTASPGGTIDVFGTTTGGNGGTRLNGARVRSGGADLLSLDFGRPDTTVSPVQPTYVGISGESGEPNFSQIVGAFTISLQGQGFFQTTSPNADLIDPSVRDFYRDYYYNNAITNGEGVQLSIAGVTPNTDYELTLWSYDADNFSPTPTVWSPTAASTGETGNVTNLQDPYPTTLSDNRTTVRVRSTTSTLTLFGTTTEGTGGTRLNGFELSLAAAGGVPGDFDASGTVNGADLTVWKNNFGAPSGATTAAGDADGDHDVDGADFLVWQRNLGAMASAAAIPEPSAAAMFVAACAAVAAIVPRGAGLRR
jgi:hypothetical protein